MTDNFEHIDVDSEEFDSAPKALRDAYKKLQDGYKTVAQERDTYKGKAHESALGGVLTGFKNPERVKRDLLAEKVDPLDSEAVSKWLEANGDDYAKGTQAPAAEASVASTQDAQAQQRLDSFNGTPVADMSKVQAFEAEITPDMDGAAIRALAAKHGI